jgi:hypothetical protein
MLIETVRPPLFFIAGITSAIRFGLQAFDGHATFVHDQPAIQIQTRAAQTHIEVQP